MWGRGDGETWRQRDRLMLLALEYYEESLCGGCGMSTLLTTHEPYDGYFTVVQAPSCLACQPLDVWRGKENSVPGPGVKHGIRFNAHQLDWPDGKRPAGVKAVTDDRS